MQTRDLAEAMVASADITLISSRSEPPHAVRDRAKLDALTTSMRRDDWVGRPLLAYDDGNGAHCLEGKE